MLLRRAGADAREDWPARPIRVVTPFPPGDQRYGDPHRVREGCGRARAADHRRGEGGRGGGHRHGFLVAKSAPDGYTSLASSGPVFTAAPALFQVCPSIRLEVFRSGGDAGDGAVHSGGAARSCRCRICVSWSPMPGSGAGRHFPYVKRRTKKRRGQGISTLVTVDESQTPNLN